MVARPDGECGEATDEVSLLRLLSGIVSQEVAEEVVTCIVAIVESHPCIRMCGGDFCVVADECGYVQLVVEG